MKTITLSLVLLVAACGIDKRQSPLTCSEGEWLVGPAGNSFSFCISSKRQSALTSWQAESYCLQMGRSVCSSDQWSRACFEHRDEMILGGYEWVSGSEFPAIAHADPYPLENPNCNRNEYGIFQGVHSFRCCSQ